jgi:Fe-S oxidoreductase
MNEDKLNTLDNRPISNKSEPEGMRPVPPDRHIAQIQDALSSNLTRRILYMLNACVRCGLCADACHYCHASDDADLVPAIKAEKLARILARYFDPLKLRLPFRKQSSQIEPEDLDALFKAAFEQCTLCGKCALTCPMGINTGEIMALARNLLCRIGRLPSGLVKPVQSAIEVGNYLGLSTEDFIENMEWTAEEMADDIKDENFTIPMDKKGAAVLYIPHPLEARDLPFLLMDAIKILYAAKENYTISSYDFDTVNYAYYQGSTTNMMQIVQRMLAAREQLQAESIVMAPCGHGYRVMRWEAEKYLGRPFDFGVYSIVELIDRYIREGRIQMAKDRFQGPIAYHDPCNIGRRGGIIRQPRNVLSALTDNYVEMEPHGARNFCCGGGGGLGSTAEYGKIRIEMGKIKAEQIRRSGAKIVATGCFNCMTQIRDLNKAYDLGIEIKSIVELVSASLIL